MSIATRLYQIARSRWRSRRRPPEPALDWDDPIADPVVDPVERAQDPVLARAWANLELPYGAGREEVNKAWKRLSRMYHPDRHAGDPERERVANQLMQGINQAYEILQRHFSAP